jgi:hypothetical protein
MEALMYTLPVAFLVLAVYFTLRVLVLRDPVELFWLLAMLAAWPVFWLLVYGRIGASGVLAETILASGVGAFFGVGMPLRVGVNLVISNRRARLFKETIICVVAFFYFCWTVYMWCLSLP